MFREAVVVNGVTKIMERPMRCSPRQARLAMLATPYGDATLFDAVQQAILLSGNTALRVSWEYSTEWSRDAPEIAQISSSLGLSPQQVDELFALAVTL